MSFLDISLGDVHMVLSKGWKLAVAGETGSGKTTLLKTIAGLAQAEEGTILFQGQRVLGPLEKLIPGHPGIAYLSQQFELPQHLRIEQVLEYANELPEEEAQELFRVCQIDHLMKRKTHQLSGGERQRIALAKLLIASPRLLLLDEPFSNLDVSLRERLSMEVREIIKNQGITAILVTHDQAEAFAIADVIGVMDHGKIQQWDTAFNLYHCPANRFVANFIGQGVFLPGRVIDAQQVEIELGLLRGVIPQHCEAGCRVDVLLRPDDIVHDDTSPLQATVMHKAFRGAEILYTLRLTSGAKVLALVPSHHDHAVGGKIGIKLEADHIVAFRQSEG